MALVEYTGEITPVEKPAVTPAFTPYTGDVTPIVQPASLGNIVSDIGKLVGAGATQTLAGAPEALQFAGSEATRDTFFKPTETLNLLADPAALTNKVVGAFGFSPIFEEATNLKIVPDAVVQEQSAALDKTLTRGKIPQLRQLTDYGTEVAKNIEDSVTPEMKQAMAESSPTGNLIKALGTGDFSELSMGQSPSAYGLAGQAAKVFGSTGTGILMSLLTNNPTVGGAFGFGQASAEGVSDARSYIEKMPEAELAQKSEYYRNLLVLGYDPITAKEMTVDKAASTAAMAQGIVGSLGGEFTGKLITGQLDKSLLGSIQNRLGKIALGTTAGMTEEGLQELGEGIATDLGIDKTIVREIGADSFANLILGAIGGGGPGAVSGAKAKGETKAETKVETPKFAEYKGEIDPIPAVTPSITPETKVTVEAAPTSLDNAQPLPAPISEDEQYRADMLAELEGVPAAEATKTPIERAVEPEIAATPAVEPAPEAEKIIQNRNRATPASINQMNQIAGNPDYDRISFSKDFANGAPVVAGNLELPTDQLGSKSILTSADGRKIPIQYGVVEADEILPSNNADGSVNKQFLDPNYQGFKAIAGNARTAGIQAAYDRGTAEQYKVSMIEDGLHGIDPSVIEGMNKPVLVRVMPQDQVTNDIGDISNVATNLTLSAVEQAKNDANRVDLQGLTYDSEGNMTMSTLRQFVQAMPVSEQASLIDTNGLPTKQAIDRLKAAIFSKAYENDELIRLAHQAEDAEAKRVINSLSEVAPQMARLEGAGEYDIRPQLVQAAELAINARRNGIKLDSLVKQQDMTVDPLAQHILQIMAENAASGKKMVAAFQDLADRAYQESQGGSVDMFGEKPKRSIEQIALERPAPEANMFNELQESKGTVGEKSTAEQVADIYRNDGRESTVVYQKGNIGLIATRKKNGDVIYIPFNGSRYSQDYTDVASTNGYKLMNQLNFTKDQKEELLNAKHDIETVEEEKHKKTPFLVMGKGVTGSAGVPQSYVNIARGWAKMLGLTGDIHIITKAEASANKDQFTGPHRPIGYMGDKVQFGSVRQLDDGSYAIVINEGSSKVRTMETIAHELGHIHEVQVYDKATPETQKAIIQEFKTWFRSHHNMSAKELVESMRPKTTAQQTEFDNPMLQASNLDAYWRNFPEWYADQVSRWAVSSTKPLTVVDKFFKKLADALTRFYATVKGAKYLPTQSMKEFLDGIAEQTKANNIIDPNDKGQMALFSQQTVESVPVTESAAFKNWFGDSKVLNDDGSPKVVYHGTKNFEGNEFKPSKKVNRNGNIDGYYFTTDPNEASGYSTGLEKDALVEGSEVIPVYLSIKNPFVKGSKVTPEMIQTFKDEIIKSNSHLGERAKEYAEGKAEVMKEYGDTGRKYAPGIFPNISFPTDAMQRVLKAGGYDGFQDGDSHWVAFDSNQIKSATGNSGSFSKENTDIRFSNQKVEAEKKKTPATIHKNYKGGPAPLSEWESPEVNQKESLIDSFLYKMQDKFIDTKRVQQAITQQVGEIEDKFNAYNKESLMHEKTAKQTQDFLRNELLPIIKDMQKHGITIQEFGGDKGYLHNRHAIERNEQIATINPELQDEGSGIKTADAEKYMDNLDPAKKKVMETLAKKVDAIIKETQRILVDSGLETQETINAWNKTYKHYMPLFRENLEFSASKKGKGTGVGTRGPSTRRAMGSTKEISEILSNVAEFRESAIMRAERAIVGRAIYGLAIKNPNTDFWLAVNPDAAKNKKKLQAELVSMGMTPEDAKNFIQEPQQPYIDPKTGLVAYRVNPALRNSDNVLPIRVNGQDRFVFFNPNDEQAMRMVGALKNLDTKGFNAFFNMIGKGTRWIASVNTQYNPVFGVWNFVRDVQGAALNVTSTELAGHEKAIMKDTLPALKGIYQDIRSQSKGKGPADSEWAKLWEDFQQAGGPTGYKDQFAKARRQASIIEREMKNLNHGNAMKVAKAVAQWLSDYNDSMENAVRLSAYKVGLDQGMSRDQAAILAKNLTVNFNRKGSLAQDVGVLYAFFNASVQGSARLIETLKGPAGRKIIAGGLLIGTMQAIALAMAGFDDDDPPEFIKARNLIIPIGDGGYVMIPMPLGYNIIPNTGRLLTEMVISGGKNTTKKIVNWMSTLSDAFNPIGGSGLQLVAPTVLDPFVALSTNKDAFGRPIYREDRANAPTPGYMRSRESASTFSKYLAEFLNYVSSGGMKYTKGAVSPTADEIDYLAGQVTGGIGREVMKTGKAIGNLFTGEETAPYQRPIVSKLIGDTEAPSNIANKFYENINAMAGHESEVKGRRKNHEDVAEYLQDNPEARLWQRANNVENQINKLNKEKRALIEKGDQEDRIKRIDEKKTKLMKDFNDKVKAAQE